MRISGISAVAIPFRESQPWEIFAELKDGTYPWFPNHLCFLGGNWGDAPSINDKNPKDTLLREIKEELDLRKPGENYLAPRNAVTILDEDVELLDSLVGIISASLRPMGDYLQTIPKEVFHAQDPERAAKKNPQDFKGICSYYIAPLTDTAWGELLGLHAKFGRLSTESCDHPISLDNMVRNGLKWIYAHGPAARDFFAVNTRRHDYLRMPMVKGVTGENIGMPLGSYDDYRNLYDIEKDPARLAKTKP